MTPAAPPSIPDNKLPKPFNIPFPNCFGPNKNPFLGSFTKSKNPVPNPSIKLTGFPIISVEPRILYIFLIPCEE